MYPLPVPEKKTRSAMIRSRVTVSGPVRIANLPATGRTSVSILISNNANNLLNGGGGHDTPTTGLGVDTFSLGTVSEADGDRVTHFSVGDLINPRGIYARTGQAGDDAFSLIGPTGSAFTPASCRSR